MQRRAPRTYGVIYHDETSNDDKQMKSVVVSAQTRVSFEASFNEHLADGNTGSDDGTQRRVMF